MHFEPAKTVKQYIYIYVFFTFLCSLLLCFMYRFLVRSLLQVQQSLKPLICSLLCFVLNYFLDLAARNSLGNEADFEKPTSGLENGYETLLLLPRFKKLQPRTKPVETHYKNT